MKKFKFRLQRVLDYRALIEKEKKRVLLERRTQLFNAEQKLSDLKQAALANKLQDTGGLNTAEVYLNGLYIQRLNKQIAEQEVLIFDLQEQVQEAISQYIEAAKELKTLVTLKERKQAEYQDQLQKEELKWLDELAIQAGNKTTLRS